MDKNQNDKKRIALDVMSGVDEEILDKATQRRITLLAKLAGRRRKKKIVFSTASVAACLAIIFCAGFLIPLFTKQIPIYTGMTISDSAPAVQGSAALPVEKEGEITLLSLSDYNPFAVSHFLKTDNPNANPNGRNPVEGEVAEEIKNSLTVTGAAENIYYAKPNQDIYVTVHIDNPDQFEIQSFTLNGEKYSSYMFEDGSDMENLILKVNVGDAEGVVEYTIDAIKYIDGTQIKDVRLEGDRTVKVGVATEDQPKAEVTSLTVSNSDISIAFTVSDQHSLIEKSAGALGIVLLDGETVIDGRELTVGQAENVQFKGLFSDHEYRIAIAAYYDSLDGEGVNLYLLYDETVRTQKMMWLDGITATQTGVSFSVIWNELATDKTLTSFALYDGEEKLCDVNEAEGAVTDLLSDHTYRLVATYRHGEHEETAEFSFTTVAKTAPTYTVDNLTATQTKVDFTIAETDVDNIGTVTKAELLEDGQVVQATENSDAYFFDGLSSASQYTVRITYTYDLNDGVGVRTETKEQEFVTLAREITVTDVMVIGKTMLSPEETTSIRVTLDNPDNVTIKGVTIGGISKAATKAEHLGKGVYIVHGFSVPAGKIIGITIDQIRYKVGNTTLSQSYEYDNGITVACLEDISIESISTKDNHHAFEQGDMITVIVQFNGIQSYQIMSMGEYPFSKIDDSTYAFTIHCTSLGEISINQLQVTYGIDNTLKKTKHLTFETIYCRIVDEFVDISTPEQFMQMTDPGNYRLTSDIDLSDIHWVPYKLKGLLYGNGYKIKNLTLTQENAVANVVSMFSGKDLATFIDIELTNVKVDISVYPGDANVMVILIANGATGGTNVFNYCRVQGSITYVDQNNRGALIYCITSGEEIGRYCSFSGIIDYYGDGDPNYQLCGDDFCICAGGSCDSANTAVVYRNGEVYVNT